MSPVREAFTFVRVYLVDVGQRFLILDQHLSKLQTLVWIHTHHIPQQKHPVWGISHLRERRRIKMLMPAICAMLKI